MRHVVEVDQSGKFEDIRLDTVLVLSDDINFTIRIPSTVKRECITILRRKGITGPRLYTQLFATGLFFLLKEKIQDLDIAFIDIEYVGKENQVKEHLLHLLERANYVVKSECIQFAHIDKHSAADIIARKTLQKKRKADRIISTEMILGEFKATKKSGIPRKREKT